MDGRTVSIHLLTGRDNPTFGVTLGDRHSFVVEETRLGGLVGSGNFDHELRIVNGSGPTFGRLEFGGMGSTIHLSVVHGLPKGFSGASGYQYEAGVALKALMLNLYATPRTFVHSTLLGSNAIALKRVFRKTKFPTAQDLSAVPALNFQDMAFGLKFKGRDDVDLVLTRTGRGGLEWGPRNYSSLYTATGINPKAENFIDFLNRYGRKGPDRVPNLRRPPR
jgi:hypothetical protein